MKHKLTPHRPEIVRRYKAGESMDKIAEAFGCTAPGIKYVLECEGIPRRPRGITSETAKAMWADPAYRERMIARRWRKPEEPIAHVVETHEHEEFRQKLYGEMRY